MPVGVYERMLRPIGERLWSKVDKGLEHDCWIWTGTRNGVGYGLISAGRRGEKPLLVHRVAFELLVGPIPAGMQLDHLCRIRQCVRPTHLEVVTNRENNIRTPRIQARRASTSCVNGHPWAGNEIHNPNGTRSCRTCRAESRRRHLRGKAAN